MKSKPIFLLSFEKEARNVVEDSNIIFDIKCLFISVTNINFDEIVNSSKPFSLVLYKISFSLL